MRRAWLITRLVARELDWSDWVTIVITSPVWLPLAAAFGCIYVYKLLEDPVTDLEQMRDTVEANLKRWEARGGKVTSYECPTCKKKCKVRQPATEATGEKGYWDSMMTCYHCGGLVFVKVYPTGKTECSEPIPADKE